MRFLYASRLVCPAKFWSLCRRRRCSIAMASVPLSSSPDHMAPLSHLYPSEQDHPLISLLEGCRTIHDFRQVHSRIIRTGLVRGPAERRRIISFCCSQHAGDMEYARLVFDEIAEPDVFLWNTMIRGFCARDSPNSAISMYVDMLRRGLKPDGHTFPFLLKSFTCATASACGKELHAHVVKFGLASNAFVRNALVHIYCLCGRLADARTLFDKSSKRGDVIMWNCMLSGYNKNMKFGESCRLFHDMKKQNVKPTRVTFLTVISACTRLKDVNLGRSIHHDIEKAQLLPHLTIENALLSMYAECGDMDSAYKVFDKMTTRDVITWTAIVKGLADAEEIDQARALFELMPQRDLVSWTAMIDGYVQMNRFREALEIFRRMQMTDVKPDAFAVVSVLTACAHLGALAVGEWIRLYADRNKISTDVFVSNALIDMYSKCGAADKAEEVFERMRQRDKFTWTAMIVGLAVNGHGERALRLFFEMLRVPVKPDGVTYVGALSACAHAGLVEVGERLFSGMSSAHGVIPEMTHYCCLVDLLGRAGHLQKAMEAINSMPMQPSCAVWGALLGACRVHKDAATAELAAERMLGLEPRDGAARVLLSGVYAACSRWDEVRRVRKESPDRRGIKKTPGCSLVELDGVVHEFVAGDRSHSRSAEIYSTLEEMGVKLKLAGYRPDSSAMLPDGIRLASDA